jgi:hypothetical protein
MFIYLASPYSSNPEHNHNQTLIATAKLIKAGYHIYSPIVHCHPVHLVEGMPKTFDFWKKHNVALLSKASELWVLDIPGWQDSIGVEAEIKHARRCQIPTSLISSSGCFREELPVNFLSD